MGPPSRHGAVTASAGITGAKVGPPSPAVLETSTAPAGTASVVATVSKKSSSVSGTVGAAEVLTLPS